MFQFGHFEINLNSHEPNKRAPLINCIEKIVTFNNSFCEWALYDYLLQRPLKAVYFDQQVYFLRLFLGKYRMF